MSFSNASIEDLRPIPWACAQRSGAPGFTALRYSLTRSAMGGEWPIVDMTVTPCSGIESEDYRARVARRRARW
jgi:hypothetical protein